MRTIFAATAALALMSAGAMLPGVARAQTPLRCEASNSTPNGSPAASGNATDTSPAGSTCETLVLPNGRTVLQDGPNADDFGADTAPHESGR